MIVVLIVVCVRLLLEVGPATDILQTLRGVPNLNEAHGLQWVERDRRMGLVSGRLLGVNRQLCSQSPAIGDLVRGPLSFLPSHFQDLPSILLCSSEWRGRFLVTLTCMTFRTVKPRVGLETHLKSPLGSGQPPTKLTPWLEAGPHLP